ncbi:MAG: GTPase HflX [Pseudomonadota bacterium]
MMEKDFLIPRGIKAMVASMAHKKIVGHANEEEIYRAIEELKELLRTLDINVVGESIAHRVKISAATVFSDKKLLEVAQEAKKLSAEVIVFDFELSATQVRNIEKLTELHVLDRNSIILEIFARHARSRESLLQVEMLRLQYLLPRLSHLYSGQGHQRGGAHSISGSGESKSEVMKKLVRQKIDQHKKELQEIGVARIEQSKKRKENTCRVALVGYTNAGKSSILNRLCSEKLLEENKLFSTVDATHRVLDDQIKPPIVLIDTVGFISNLPKNLQQGFRTTLESALEAQLLVMVCDVSNHHVDFHIQVTNEVLKKLNTAPKDVLYVFNKKDLLPGDYVADHFLHEYPRSLLVSSFDPADMKRLKEAINHYFMESWPCQCLYIPYSVSRPHALLAAKANVIESCAKDEGVYYKVRLPESLFRPLNLENYVISQDKYPAR